MNKVEDYEALKKSPFKEGGLFDGAHPFVFENAKALRKNMTEAEKLLWYYLKGGFEGLKFRRQHALGRYIPDFYCHKLKLIIELDGNIHEVEEVKSKDDVREDELRKAGYDIVRFKNQEVFQDIDKVLQIIKEKIQTFQSI